jgi:chromate transporter
VSAVAWAAVAGHLIVLSLLQIGGALVIAPDVHRLLVEQFRLLTDAQFNASIAIAQAAPGPNVLWAAVAGFQTAGVLGSVLTLTAVLGPSSLLAVAMGRIERARGEGRALQAFKAGMAPITIALISSTSWLLLADTPSIGRTLVATVTAVAVWRTRVHILWLIGLGAVAGAFGWL